MTASFKIVTGRPDAELAAAWSACVSKWERATPFIGPEFLVDKRNSGLNPFAILAINGDAVRGVLTGTNVDGRALIGIECRPQVYIERDAPAWVSEQLVAGLREYSSQGVKLVSVCSWDKMPVLAGEGYREKSFGVPVAPILLDLAKGTEQLFKEFSATRRTRIRQAIRAKVLIDDMQPSDFDAYYQIYSEWCEMKGFRAQARDAHEELLRDRSDRLVLVARHNGKVIGASIFRFRLGGMMEYGANVSRREESAVHQNDVLIWEGIKRASDLGLRIFSTGASHFFLQRFGGTTTCTYRYRLDKTFLRRYFMADLAMDARSAIARSMPQSLKAMAKRVSPNKG